MFLRPQPVVPVECLVFSVRCLVFGVQRTRSNIRGPASSVSSELDGQSSAFGVSFGA